MLPRALPLILAGLLLPVLLAATAQSPDILYIGTTQYRIHTNPLAPYLAANPGRLPTSAIVSSANWRGYIATWEIADRRLLLKNVTILVDEEDSARDDEAPSFRRRSVLRDLFPDQDSIVATWYAGYLVVPKGEMIEYVHQGYASTYEEYSLIRVERGIVTSHDDVDAAGYRKFRVEQFNRYKQTERYRESVERLLKSSPEDSEAELESFLFDFSVGEYTSTIYDD